MKVPNANQAKVEDDKIIHYLMSLQHPDGQSKARFLISFGYTPDQWQRLAAALRQHVVDNDAVEQKQTIFGNKWIVEGPLETPDGRNPHIRTIWFIPNGTDIPNLVTAYPIAKVRQ